ncbi:hypothetical protein DDF62_22395 [Caulobacter radicis]|uniref:TonB-dependent receptor n=1 Tax=Caulobacter radicis TaxID=2172650 RepID=UPI000D563A36|nr:TonB-dependent receptor [Caulobacter radicis]PVM84483.1 hypothetical protein DDF62_22395 [Caulobacter radicis]
MAKRHWLCAVAASAIATQAGAQATQADASTASTIGGQQNSAVPAPLSPVGAAVSAADEATNDSTVQAIIVTGYRRSLTSAANLKRNSNQIQDSIVAEDVGKLPDTNIAETLQRVPGVQLTRNARGEGNAFSIHGLSQNQTLLNGRGIFQTGNRNAALLDISADILSGIDIYKTGISSQIEGGLGGLVNIKTAHPFDHKVGSTLLSASGNYSVIRNRVLPRLVASTSGRWDTSIGEVGVLLSSTYEQIYSGAFDVNTNTYSSRTNIYDRDGDGVFSTTAAGGDPGDAIMTPGQVQARYVWGERTRFSTNFAAQWQPSNDLLVTFDTLYFYSNGRGLTRGLAAQIGSASGATPPFTFANSGKVASGATYTGVPIVSTSTATTNPYRTLQTGLNAVWTSGNWTVTPDISYTSSVGPFYSHTSTFSTSAPSVTVDLGTSTPNLTVAGVNLLDPGKYNYVSFLDSKSIARGWEKAAKIDVRYDMPGGPVTALLAGVRYTNHRMSADSFGITYSAAAAPIGQSNATVLSPTPESLFGSVSSWLATGAGYVTDLGAARRLIGRPTADPAYDPLRRFEVTEDVVAGYGEAQFQFDLGPVPIDGNLGLRALHTISRPTSFQRVSGALTPVSARTEYTNLLPSINVRAKFTPDLFLRLAASKALYRPDYSSLNPVVGITPNLQTGSAGNPELRPITANQYDLSLEYYFGKSNLLAASLYRKDVDGFIQTFSLPETIQGVVYQISRPRNGGSGRIQGFELNYQQFFDFLPGLLDGLGVQANFTYVDSAINVAGLTGTRPAQAISKASYNLAAIYERDPVSIRLSYNRRSRYVDITSADAAGNILWVAPLNSLDLSSTFALTDRIGLKFDAVNLTGAVRREYYATRAMPQIANRFDRSFEAGIRVKF